MPSTRSDLAGLARASRLRLLAASGLAFVLLASLAPISTAAAEAAPAPLDAWFGALSTAPTEPADVVFVGDSITQGFGATSRDDWWVGRTRTQLQRAWGGTGSGYLPASPTFWPADAGAWTLSGGADIVTTGLGLRSYALTTASAELHTAVDGTTFDLAYAVGPRRGLVQVVVDGVVVDEIDTSAPEAAGGMLWTSPPLGAGPHDLRVRARFDPDHQEAVVVEGIQESAAPGVRVWDAGHGGYGSAHFVNERGWEGGLAAADPELVVIALGTNDYTFRTTAAQFEANLSAMVDAVRQAADGPVSIALMPVWRGRGRDALRYDELVQAQRRLAADEGLALIDLSAADAGVLTDDGLHPNTIGQQVLASAVLDVIDPSFVAAGATTPPADPSTATAAVNPSTGAVEVAWSASPGEVSGYRVLAYDLATGTVASHRTITGTSTSFALKPGRYVVGVHAGNAAGFSKGVATNVVSSKTKASDPTGVVARHDTATASVLVSWTAPADPVRDFAVIAYDSASGAVVGIQTVTAASASFALKPGRYIFGVHSGNASGYSRGTASNTVDVPRLTVPPNPTDVVASVDTAAGTVTVAWTAPVGPVRDYAVLAYDLATGRVVAHKTVTSTSETFDLPAGRYVFGVHAGNDAGYSKGIASNVIVVST